MAAADTPLHVQRRVTALYAAMTGAERVELAAEMAEEAKTIALAGIRERHPDMSESDLAAAWFRLLHGNDIAERALRCNSSS